MTKSGIFVRMGPKTQSKDCPGSHSQRIKVSLCSQPIQQPLISSITTQSSLTLREADRVIINSLGTLEVRTARLSGCHITAKCAFTKNSSGHNPSADGVIHNRTTDLIEILSGYDEIYNHLVDSVGISPQYLTFVMTLFISSNINILSRTSPGHVQMASIFSRALSDHL